MYGSERMTIRQTLTLLTVTVPMKISPYKATATNHDHTAVTVFVRGKLVSLKTQHAVSRNQTWNLLQHKHACLYIMQAHRYTHTQVHTHADTHTHTHTHTEKAQENERNKAKWYHPRIHNSKETETLPSTLAPTQRTMRK